MNKCKTCDMNCSDSCYKEDNYKPERALVWFGVVVMCWIVVALAVLS